MWTRKELKEKAKVAFYRNYWRVVLVALIAGIVAGSGIDTGARNGGRSIQETVYAGTTSEGIAMAGATIGLLVVLLIILAIIALVDIFLFNPLNIGTKRFFEENRNEVATLSGMSYGFRSGAYLSNVGTMFMRDLFIFLWSLIALIPGGIVIGVNIAAYTVVDSPSLGRFAQTGQMVTILVLCLAAVVGSIIAAVKAYQYKMIPYILANNPGISRKRAFELTKEMMTGQKWKAFVLDLSFILWHILTVIPFAGFVVKIFYVGPYVQTTWVEFYDVQQRRVLEEGFSTAEELPEV